MNKWFLLLLLLAWMFFRVECLSVTKAFFVFFVFLNGLGSDFCGMGNATCILGLD